MTMTRAVCRVCGMDFVSPRCDAITCTDTCRQRLKRGQALAYLATLSKSEQRVFRRYHVARDATIAAHKAAVAATRQHRDLERAHQRRESERERERLVAEIVGRGYIAEQKKRREQAARSTVASVLMLFAKERRNDMSAEAIAKFLDTPDDYPADEIAQALDQLRASGDYDLIVNEAAPP
jgi:hypothetical protein